MSSGSRSRAGCYTCRIRKKKCDETRPSCGSCNNRNLPCYGYDAPPPDWMQGKRSWKDVVATEEARQLRSLAEVQYKARRRYGEAEVANAGPKRSQRSDLVVTGNRSPALESIWWDSGFCASLPIREPSHKDTRLLMLYLNFIFPIQFSFYSLSTAADHNWLMSGLCDNQARYHAALSVSACFDASLSEPRKTDRIGLSLEVAERQATVSRDLQTIITQFGHPGHTPRGLARIGGQILEVMHQLLSLEVFSMLEGTWELHHQATMTLLDTLHNYRVPDPCGQIDNATCLSSLETALQDFSSYHAQRTFEFHVTCAIWIDVIANATFGLPLCLSRNFNYIPHLRSNAIKTQGIMGCHSSIMATIAEVTCLADWKTSQLELDSLILDELFERAAPLATRLEGQIQELEQQALLNLTKDDEESRLVTKQFAYAAQAYLHVVIFGPDTTHPGLALLVGRGLQMLESLPHRPMIRVHWAFTTLGCLAGRSLHARFRRLIVKLVDQNQPLGVLWKGLMVMEECWRLRQLKPELEGSCDWQMAMKSLNKRILLV